jgi:hypothetical protein
VKAGVDKTDRLINAAFPAAEFSDAMALLHLNGRTRTGVKLPKLVLNQSHVMKHCRGYKSSRSWGPVMSQKANKGVNTRSVVRCQNPTV